MDDRHPDDEDLFAHIDELTARIDELHERSEEDEGLDAGDAVLIHDLRVERDRYWDLIRQRRAKRDAGLDPNEAELRSASTVESYLQ
jgi:hypothetical protein